MHNVHLDRLEASTRTFFIPGVNNVHLDRAGRRDARFPCMSWATSISSSNGRRDLRSAGAVRHQRPVLPHRAVAVGSADTKARGLRCHGRM